MIMKRTIFALLATLLLCAGTEGKTITITENDSLGNPQRVIELRDTVIDGRNTTDTLSITTYEGSSGGSTDEDNHRRRHSSAYDFGWEFGNGTRELILSVTAIVFVFGLPMFVVFTVFYFRYKNRKARYRLVEQALASGQPLPENLFREGNPTDIRSKGIKNIFVGIGLFILLWSLTGEFGIGCIGLLVMFTGFGQLVIHYTQQERSEKDKER